jgi:NADH-quinone oxidoreductase subunit N
MQFLIPELDILAIGPALAVTLTGCAVMLVDLYSKRFSRKGYLASVSLIGLMLSAVVSILAWGYFNPNAFAGMVAADNFSQFFNLLFVFIAAVTVLLSHEQLEREDFHAGEYYTLLLFSTAGMMLMASATDLVMIFLGLELLSICLYILTGFSRHRPEAEEASMKYLLLGSFATGFLLYGIALVYGATASTNLGCVAQALGVRTDFATAACAALPVAPVAAAVGFGAPVMLLAGMALLIVGLGFKAAVAPFHMWTPDVYEGAPTAITAFMSVAAKAAAFAAIVRVFLIAFPNLAADWGLMLGVIAIITMLVGNTVAIYQQNIKRMLAYSSIAHAGYILVAIVAASQLGAQSVLFYTVAYTLMNLGAFAIVILVGKRGEENELLSDYAGLGYRRPVLGALMTLFMLSLAGIPPTVGFVGKFYIFAAALQSGWIWLAIVGVLASVISVYFYLRVVYLMYMVEPAREFGPADRAPWAVTAAYVTGALVLLLGLFPGVITTLAQDSVRFVLG